MTYKLTNEEQDEIMDKITDLYHIIDDIKKQLNVVYEGVGEICNIVKCADTEEFETTEGVRQ